MSLRECVVKLLYELIDVAKQRYWIKLSECIVEPFSGGFRGILSGNEPLCRSLRGVIFLFDLGSGPGL